MSKKKDDDKVKLVLNSEDGAIIFRSEASQEYFIAPAGDDPRSEYIRACIAFFVFASQRRDWVEEFNKSMIESYENEFKEQNKPHLRLVEDDEEKEI